MKRAVQRGIGFLNGDQSSDISPSVSQYLEPSNKEGDNPQTYPLTASAQPTENAYHALRKGTNTLIGADRNETVNPPNQSLAMAGVTR